MTLVSGNAYAQSGQITGKIMSEEKKEEIKNVKVILIQASNPIDSSFTDKKGNFIFENIGLGTYDLKILKKKYMTKIYQGLKINDKELELHTITIQKGIDLGPTICTWK